MTPAAIRLERQEQPQGVVYRITVANAAKLNILNGNLTAELCDALLRTAADDDARLVILTGDGSKAWIGGADITEMAALRPDSAEAFIVGLHDACVAIREHPVPVIAEIRGYCLGAGLELAACCDLRLAARGSSFGMPEVRVGIPSVIEAALLPRLIGAGRARDLVLTGRIIDAETAYAWGFLNGLVPEAELDDLVRERSDEILSAGPRAIRAQKKLCRGWEELPLGDAVQAGVKAYREAFETDEPARYMQRFLGRKRSGS